MNLYEIAELSHEVDMSTDLVERERVNVFNEMRDAAREILETGRSTTELLDTFNTTIEDYVTSKFINNPKYPQLQESVKTKGGRIKVKSFTIPGQGESLAEALREDGFSVIGVTDKGVVVRVMPSDWYASYVTLTRAITHNLENPGDTVDWTTLTKNQIEAACKPRKEGKPANPNALLNKAIKACEEAVNAHADRDAAKAGLITLINRM